MEDKEKEKEKLNEAKIMSDTKASGDIDDLIFEDEIHKCSDR